MANLRSIALCNVVYKVIAKVIALANKLKLILPHIIYETHVGVHSHGGWSSTIGDKALLMPSFVVGCLPQIGGTFFFFAINHGKCSCLYLQRMPINWHSMKRRKSSQSLLQFLCFEFPFESQESSRREEGKIRGSENRGCSLLGISTPGRV